MVFCQYCNSNSLWEKKVLSQNMEQVHDRLVASYQKGEITYLMSPSLTKGKRSKIQQSFNILHDWNLNVRTSYNF